jgi:hypothetical protein
VIHLTRGELLDLVLDIEDRLRRLMRSVLSEEGPEWEKLIPKSIQSKLELVKGSADSASGDLLDKASLGQLIQITLHLWPQFEKLLGDKQTFSVRANEFRQWRNSLAHGKSPSPEQKVEIAVVLRQVGQQIPVVTVPQPLEASQTVIGGRVLWVDDHPEWNLRERQIFRMLGIEVVPVLSNDEAIDTLNERPVALVISDIDRGDGEPGNLLPSRLHTVGVNVPVLFYVGEVDPGRDMPAGAASLTNDPAILVRDALTLLSRAT